MRLFRFVMPLLLPAIAIFLVTAGCRYGDGDTYTGPAGDTPSDRAVLFGRVLGSAATVNSSVRAANAELLPIAGAEVWLENLPYFPHRVTNASGEYIFENIPAGKYRLVASFTSAASKTSLKSRSDVRTAVAAQPGEIPAMTLLAATKGVSGILRDAAGAPWAAGTKIVIWGEIITVQSGGFFTGPPLPTAETRADLSVLTQSEPTSPTSRPASTTVMVPVSLLTAPVQIEVTVPTGSEGGSLNRPPIVSLAVARTTLAPGEQIACSADAMESDPEDQGKAQTVSWSASAGTITGSAADVFSATFTAPLTPGLATISVTVADVRGASGKASIRVTVSETQNGSGTPNPDDVIPPTVVLTSTSDSVTNGAFPVTITFSEKVLGFDLSKLTVGNGTAGNLQQITANLVYTCTITPAAAGIVTIDLAAGMVADAAGNRNLAATRLPRSYGSNSPTVVFSSTTSATTNAVIPLTITFSEEIIGFYLSKLTIKNGFAHDRRMPTPNRVFTCLVTPIVPGTVTVDLEAGKVVNVAGNGNLAASRFVRLFDARPVAVLSTTAPAVTNMPIPLTISFSEDVYGFDLAKLSIVNGTAGEFQTVTANRAYSCVVTPSVSGSVTIDLDAGMVVDSIGNTNFAARQISRIFDEIAPAAVLTSRSPSVTNEAFDLTITFSEEIVGFDLSKLEIVNGTAGSLQTKTANLIYTCTVTPGVSGDVMVDLHENRVADVAGNGNTRALQFTRIYDNIAPNNQNAVLASDTAVKGKAAVSIGSSGDVHNTIWLAPDGTTTFSQGETMTTTVGDATFINAPGQEGVFKLFVIDMAGNVSSGSVSTVTVDNTAPSNQDVVLAADKRVRPGVPVPIVSSGDADNSVWLAISGSLSFHESSNMTTSGGTATSIRAPMDEGAYSLYVIDSVKNVSQPSTALVTVDGTPAAFVNTYPKTESVSMETADILVKITETGTIYYKCYNTVQGALTATGLKSAGTAVEAVGETERAIQLTDLEPNTQYYVYFAVEDAAGNLNLYVSGISIQTTASSGDGGG